ncbi:MAG: hypothetical protein FWF69_05405 [Firmicutes bacterium]|nr:hypothetical protein [Bacillota bacterium]
MKMMLFYELKKMFNLKKIIICGTSMIALCAIIFFGRASSLNLFENLPDIKQKLNIFSGEITSENMKPILQRYEEIINDPNHYTEVDGERIFTPSAEIRTEMDKFEYILFLHNSINSWPQRMIDRLQENLTDPGITPAQELLIKQNIEMLSKKGNLIVGYNLFYDYYNSFLKNFAPFLLGFLMLFFLAPVFSNEYATKMDGLILSSKHGKKGVIIAKFFAAFIGINAFFILVFGTYILIAGIAVGFSGGQTSFTTTLHDAFQYVNSPYNFTMFQFLLFSLAVSWGACIGFGVFILFISSKIRNTMTVSAISLPVFILPLFFYAVDNSRDEFTGIINFSYGRIMQVAPLIDRFNGFVLLGNVIMLKDVLLILLSVTTGMLAFFTYRSWKKREVAN